MKQHLQDAVVRLTTVLRAENAALTAQDFGLVGSFVAEKSAALTALNALSVKHDPGVQGEDRPPAERLGFELRQVAAENKRLLEQAILVQNRIMAILAGAARQAQTPQGYAAKGHRPRAALASAVALIVRA